MIYHIKEQVNNSYSRALENVLEKLPIKEKIKIESINNPPPKNTLIHTNIYYNEKLVSAVIVKYDEEKQCFYVNREYFG